MNPVRYQGARKGRADFFAGLPAADLLKDGVSTFAPWGFTDLDSRREDERPLYFGRSLDPKQPRCSMLDARGAEASGLA
jgi:hypothetical protein